MSSVKHVLGISGGKDSAALAIYLTMNYPELPVEYYFLDTGKELDETYQFIDALEVFLGKKVERLEAAKGSPLDPFDHYLRLYGGYLPSVQARWCTRKLKLEPFEQFFVGDTPAISYVAIRGDEDREGYISHKPNIQSIFPFRRNIWSKDIVTKVLSNQHRELVSSLYRELGDSKIRDSAIDLINRPESAKFNQIRKLNMLLDLSIATFNHVVFAVLKSIDCPMSDLDFFPLLDNEDNIDRDGVFRLLEESGVGKPQYYEPIEFELNGQKGYYNRSRSGCYFCFFQQKIEWVWLYEQHPERFAQALEYEKEGYSWMDDERLEELIRPERIAQIKAMHIEQTDHRTSKSSYLIDVLMDSESIGCATCFI